jgi:F-type H+-transporting ATPase subunit b
VDINATLLGQAISFILLVLFTMKFVWPPLNSMLEERATRIADGLAAAEKGRLELQNAESRVIEELKQVQLRATEIIANAEKRGEQLVADAVNKASLESAKVLSDAKAKVAQEFIRAREELRSEVAVLALRGAEQILRSEIDSAKHEKILSAIKMEL